MHKPNSMIWYSISIINWDKQVPCRKTENTSLRNGEKYQKDLPFTFSKCSSSSGFHNAFTTNASQIYAKEVKQTDIRRVSR